METLLLFIPAFAFARMTAAFNENLLFPQYFETPHIFLFRWLISKNTVSGHKTEPTYRYRFTYAGLITYLVFFVCLAVCVKIGLAPMSDEQLIASEMSGHRYSGVLLQNEAQMRTSFIAVEALAVNLTLWFTNRTKVRIMESEQRDERIFMVVVYSIICIVLVIFSIWIACNKL